MTFEEQHKIAMIKIMAGSALKALKQCDKYAFDYDSKLMIDNCEAEIGLLLKYLERFGEQNVGKGNE